MTNDHTDPDDERRTDGGTTQAREAMRDAGPTDDVPEDAIATVEDFTHKRDRDGDLLPTMQKLPGRDKYVKVVPITQGDANEYLPESGNPMDLDDEQMLELLREFYVAPDFSDVENVDDVVAFGLDPLLMTLFEASGFDMAKGMITDQNEFVETIQGNTNRGS